MVHALSSLSCRPGAIPEALRALSNLTELNLCNNQLTGDGPFVMSRHLEHEAFLRTDF